MNDAWTPYSFGNNNPISFIDPLGLDTVKAKVGLPNDPKPGQVVTGPNSGGGTSSYIYDPSNPGADENGLVGNGIVDAPEYAVVVTAKKKNSNNSSGVTTGNVGSDLIIPTSHWRTQAPDWNACFRTSQTIAGYTAPPGAKITTAREVGRTLQILPAAQQGLRTIDVYLGAGRPIIVGVTHTFGRTANDGTTDHFRVIVGSGFANGMRYFRFFDPGTQHAFKRTSSLNRLIFAIRF